MRCYGFRGSSSSEKLRNRWDFSLLGFLKLEGKVLEWCALECREYWPAEMRGVSEWSTFLYSHMCIFKYSIASHIHLHCQTCFFPLWGTFWWCSITSRWADPPYGIQIASGTWDIIFQWHFCCCDKISKQMCTQLCPCVCMVLIDLRNCPKILVTLLV